MAIQAIDQLLGELNRAAELASGKSSSTVADAGAPSVDFAEMLKASLNKVSSAQQASKAQEQQLEQGDPNTNLEDVMMSLQKASISFQTMVQVRNKLVSAYQEIMNTQV